MSVKSPFGKVVINQMAMTEKWIWLPEERYPDRQKTIYSASAKDLSGGNFTVAEFCREYDFGCDVAEAKLRFSGDTEFRLYLNGEILATGPINVGGDFLFNEEPRSKHYASELTLNPGCQKLSFFAQVKMMPVAVNEYSRGHGGFMLSAELKLSDGRTKFIFTDETWSARLNRAFADPERAWETDEKIKFSRPFCYNQELDTDAFGPAQPVDNIWHCETAPIHLRSEEILRPDCGGAFTVAPGEKKTVELRYDMIHAGFVTLNVQAKGPVEIHLDCLETEVVCAHYDLRFVRDDHYRALQVQSVGLYRITAENHSGCEAVIDPYLTATYYPVFSEAKTVTGDKDLNLVMDVCRHTLKYCRQMIHIDGPTHNEPLACTGDYYIESLMTAMSFGDMSLAEFDVERTAELLRVHDGRMFHTTYSLIWVQMLWDVYRITGNRTLLNGCLDALTLLLDRFETYIGENGLIETPPDFMFVDWIYIDEISMHHPPKALGQTCLCAFYHGALLTAAKIYRELGREGDAIHCEANAADLNSAVNALLYDSEKGLYFDGLNTPTPEELLYRYMPQNIEKRYYMPHSNILCALYGLCDDETGRRLIRAVVADREWGAIQPYFMHFLLQAIDRLDLRDECTLAVLENWKAPILTCPRGLVEGFIPPEPTYSFDHSHAWSGTPLYTIPKHLLGLEILEPGYKKIRLNPTLMGLESARAEVPTPFGTIIAEMEAGREPAFTIPDGIEVVF